MPLKNSSYQKYEMRNTAQVIFGLITVIAISFFISACTQTEPETVTFSGEVTFGKLVDNKKHSEFLDKLASEGIGYRISNRGYVVHKVEATAKVRGIRRTVLYGLELRTEVEEIALYSGMSEREYIANQLKEYGIPHRIREDKKYQNMGAFLYSQSYGPQVDTIMQKVMVTRDRGMTESQ